MYNKLRLRSYVRDNLNDDTDSVTVIFHLHELQRREMRTRYQNTREVMCAERAGKVACVTKKLIAGVATGLQLMLY